MESIATIANQIQPGENWQPAPPVNMKVPKQATLAELDTSNELVAFAVQQARAWAKRKRGGYLDASMILSGPYGTGKTHIAKAILWSMRDTPDEYPNAAVPAGRFYLANDLLLRLSPTRDKATGVLNMPRPSALIGTAPIVVIDDVGGQQIIPYVAKEDQEYERHARYFLFVDKCYSEQVSLIITTNLSIVELQDSQFAKHIGGRAFDRLQEMAPVGFMVGLDDVPSWRQKVGGR